MAEPHIAGTKPAVMKLEPGKYFWCACGLSKNQPWCDGSHKDTEFKPVQVEITEEKNYAMCTCKRSAKGAFCDGTHRDLQD